MPDEGYFPRGRSVLRRVHRERVVGYLYGQRALLMQATHPVAFAGLTATTSGLDAPFQRLAHTAKTMEAVFFGTRAEADRETARVRALHARVRGALQEPAGPHPEGSSCLHRTTCSMPIQLITAMPENRSPCHDSPASLMLIYDRFPALDAPLKSVRCQLP